VDSKGNAKLVVVSDTRIPGIGKEAAFEYSMIMRQNNNGDVVMPISEERIKSARGFSYDQSDAGEDADVRTIPAGGYSIDKLLSANVVDAKGDKVASVENITFRNGKADALIIGYDKTLGMGGKKAALRFSDVKLNSKGDGDAELQLTAAQSSQLESMKDRGSN
jgi:sporulation protein YlmC with PRC-barrel domain